MTSSVEVPLTPTATYRQPRQSAALLGALIPESPGLEKLFAPVLRYLHDRPMSRRLDRRPKPRERVRPSEKAAVTAKAPSRQAKWAMRLALLVMTPVIALLVAEGALRLVGYGYPVSFFVRPPSSDFYTTNQKFAWQFFSRKTVLKPFLFSVAAKKPAGTLRICILGESEAMGTPDPAFSFGRILETMLQRQYPQAKFEVMNAAMRGINSHVIRRIARECARHEVDAFIIYMGNNEVVGIHAPSAGSPSWTQSLTLIRAGEWARRTRLGQLLAGVMAPGPEGHAQDMEYFRAHRLPADDPLREKNSENFRANLDDILDAAAASGAKMILSTVAVNLKDCPPLASSHRPNLSAGDLQKWQAAVHEGEDLERAGQFDKAVTKYLEAGAIDNHFAELHYRLGRCYWSKQEWALGKEQFVLARDWDALQFRTDSRLNQIIRETAAARSQNGVVLLDSEKNFNESDLSDHQVPGGKLFYEHVHANFAGNYLLAKGCYDALTSMYAARLPKPATNVVPTAQQCADDIAYTVYDEVNVNAAMVRLTGNPPFLDQLDHASRQAAAEAENQKRLAAFGPAEAQRSLDTYVMALQKRPDDWPIHFNLALFCQELKRNQQAVEQFEYLVSRFPEVKNFRVGLGNALLSSGSNAAAISHFQAALRLDPEDRHLREELQQLRAGKAAP